MQPGPTKRQKELAKRRDAVTGEVEKAESRINAINELFCDPTFFDRTSRDQVKKLENEQKTLSGKVEELMAEWERRVRDLPGARPASGPALRGHLPAIVSPISIAS